MTMDSVLSQLQSAGLIIDGLPETGRLVRCKAEGDRGGKESGWYVLHDFRLDNGDVVQVGRYGNWKTMGNSSLAIEFSGAINADEQERMKAETKRLRELAAAEKAERAASAAKRAREIWAKLPQAGASDYLNKKNVPAYGLRFSRGSIVVPVRNVAGDLTGLQFIAGDGIKKFLTGTAKAGAFHAIGSFVPGAPLCIAEGYATAATIHKIMGWPVAVAFDAGNLSAVALALRNKYPAQPILICADNDAATPGNPGVTKAREAARLVGAVVAVPVFEPVPDLILEAA